jgi:hypothetical protein
MSNLLQYRGVMYSFALGLRGKVDRERGFLVEYWCVGTLTIE